LSGALRFFREPESAAHESGHIVPKELERSFLVSAVVRVSQKGFFMPTWVRTPDGSSAEVVRSFVQHDGTNYGSNRVMLRLTDGSEISIKHEGPVGGVCPPVSDWMQAYGDEVARRIAEAGVKGKVADLRGIKVPGTPHDIDYWTKEEARREQFS
jgi:hypothetical protein